MKVERFLFLFIIEELLGYVNKSVFSRQCLDPDCFGTPIIYSCKIRPLNCNFSVKTDLLSFVSLIHITEVFLNFARWYNLSIFGKKLSTFKETKYISLFSNILHQSPLFHLFLSISNRYPVRSVKRLQ